MKKVFIFSLLFYCITAGASSFAAESAEDIRVKAEVDKAFLTIGDPVTYTVTVEHAPDIQILSDFPAPSEDMLEIKSTEDINQKNRKTITTGRKFVLTAFRLGEFVLNPITVEYRKDGQSPKKIQTNKLYLNVRSIAAEVPKEDIRDVKSVVPFLWRFWKYVWTILGLALILAGIWTYRKLRQKALLSPKRGPVLTPEEEALLHLRELFDSDFLRRGLVKAYYLRLSEILRTYFEKRYRMLAVESTTFEILQVLQPPKIEPALFEKIKYVLEISDLAKFAKWIPTPAEVLSINKKSEEIIRDSTPAPEPSVTPEVPHDV